MAHREEEYYSELTGAIGLCVSSSLLAILYTTWRLSRGEGRTWRYSRQTRRQSGRRKTAVLLMCFALSFELMAYLGRSALLRDTSLVRRGEIVFLPIIGRSVLELSACVIFAGTWIRSERASVVACALNGTLLFALAVLSLLLCLSALDRRVEREWRQNFIAEGGAEDKVGEKEYFSFLHASFLGVAHQLLESVAWGLQSILIAYFCALPLVGQMCVAQAGDGWKGRAVALLKACLSISLSTSYAFRSSCLVYHATSIDTYFDEAPLFVAHQRNYWIFWLGCYWIPTAISVMTIAVLYESGQGTYDPLHTPQMYEPLLLPPGAESQWDWYCRQMQGRRSELPTESLPPIREVFILLDGHDIAADEALSTGS